MIDGLPCRHLTTRRLAIGGLIFITAMIVLQVVFFIQQKERANLSRQRVEHSYVQIREVENVYTKISDIEASQLNFLLTGDKRFLDSFLKDIDGDADSQTIKDLNRPLHAIISDLQTLYADDTERQDEVANLNILLDKKRDFINRTMTARRQNGIQAAVALMRIGQGEELMDQIRNQTDVMIRNEQDELKQRMDDDLLESQRLTIYTSIAAFITYTFLFAAMLSIIRIFSRARAIERQLHAKEEWFRAAADGSIDGFFLFHAVFDQNSALDDLVLDYLNPVAEQMTRRTLTDMLGKSIDAVLFPESDTIRTFDIYRSIFERQTAMEREYTVQGGPLAGRILLKQAIPLPSGIAITCRDITERKQIEQMKNEFVSTVSHELRTPLTSIRGSLGLVTGGVVGALPDQVKSLLTIAYNNCERLVRLINDILDIEKIESGRMMFDNRPLEIQPILQQAIQDNEGFAKKYWVNLILDMPEPITGRILADSDRLIQIITNLLSNAIKFSPPGSDVTLRCIEKDRHLCIDVIDRGSGIPILFRNKIFQKFAQADGSDTRQKSGTGLGLAITKALVEQMQGNITFDTIEQKGTTFHILFPTVKPEHDIIHAVTFSPDHDLPSILVCEDDHDIANLLLLILEKAGFAVDLAETAQEAFQKLQSKSYAAMTLDLILPDREGSTFRDGLAFIHKIRNTPSLANLPIVIVSAKADEGQQIFSGDAIGILDWLAKPIAVDRLVEIVKALPTGAQRPLILHVEDDPDISHILAMTLSPLADIVRATTVEQARIYIQNQSFDLMILDVGLPDGQGTDLLPLLNKADGSVTPVVLFTASDVTPDVSAAVAATLVKSRTSEANLLETIRHMIAKRPDT